MMVKWTLVLASVLFALLAVTPVNAQQPGTPAQPDAHAAPGAAMPMMDMCRQMMGDPAGMPMMQGMMPADPKDRAAMMEMRGEMMKAMGDVMMKHAQRMQRAPAK